MKHILEYNKSKILKGKFRIGDIVYPIKDMWYLKKEREYQIVEIRYSNFNKKYKVKVLDTVENQYITLSYSSQYYNNLVDIMEMADWIDEDLFQFDYEIEGEKYNL